MDLGCESTWIVVIGNDPMCSGSDLKYLSEPWTGLVEFPADLSLPSGSR